MASPAVRFGAAGEARGNPARVFLFACLFVGAWAAVILLFALQLRYANGLRWNDALSRATLDRGPWAILSPLIVALAWWTQQRRLGVWRTLGMHAAGIVAALLLSEALVQGVFLRFLFPWRIAATIPLEQIDGRPGSVSAGPGGAPATESGAAPDASSAPAEAIPRAAPAPVDASPPARREEAPDAQPAGRAPPSSGRRDVEPGAPDEWRPGGPPPRPPPGGLMRDGPQRDGPPGQGPGGFERPPRFERQGYTPGADGLQHAILIVDRGGQTAAAGVRDGAWLRVQAPPRLPRELEEGVPRPVRPPPGDSPPPPPEFAPGTPAWWMFIVIALRKGYNGVPIYLLIAALSHAFLFWRNLRERESRVSELEERLLIARADMLRLQLEPHFLYNTLNAIGTLVYRDAALADDLIARLSTLLRRLLDLRDEHTIALEKELETVRAYVGIEQARFGERLKFEEDIAPEVRAFPIPVMLLQPLAENAVRHGIEPLGRPGTLRIAAAMRAGMLDILVEDDGAGMAREGNAGSTAGGENAGFGIGLAGARLRLTALYGDGATINAQPRLGGGTRIEIRVPKKLALNSRRKSS